MEDVECEHGEGDHGAVEDVFMDGKGSMPQSVACLEWRGVGYGRKRGGRVEYALK